VYSLELASEPEISPFLQLLRATAELDASVARINNHSVFPNVHAQVGYRKNCAAAIGRWETMYAHFESQLSYRSRPVPALYNSDRTQDIRVRPAIVASLSSELGHEVKGDFYDLPAESIQQHVDLNPNTFLTATLPEGYVRPVAFCSHDTVHALSCMPELSFSSSCYCLTCGLLSNFYNCPNSLGASPSSIVRLGTLPPSLPLSQISSSKDEILKEKYSPDVIAGEQSDIEMEEFENFSDTFVARALLRDEDQLNDENIPDPEISSLAFFDPLLIPPVDFRPKRSSLATLYEQKAKLHGFPPFTFTLPVKFKTQQQSPKMKRKMLPPLRALSLEELSRLEILHERANCIDDWTWAFGDEAVDVGDDVVVRMCVVKDV
jgi:hypothetical protein